MDRPWTWARIVGGVRKHAPAAIFDAAIVVLSFSLALLLRFDGRVPESEVADFLTAAPFLILFYLLANLLAGMYWRVWRYAGLADILILGQAVLVSTLFAVVADFVLTPLGRPLPLSVVLMGGGIAFVGMSFAKFWPRLRALASLEMARRITPKILIVGAGQAGRWLARELMDNYVLSLRPVGFVDDDPHTQGTVIQGLPVMGGRHAIPKIVDRLGVDIIAIAIPSAPRNAIQELVAICEQTPARIQIVPGIREVMAWGGTAATLRDLTVEDLLGRDEVEIDLAQCAAYIAGKRVMITGAAGSIGSELARQVLALKPSQLTVLDMNESGIYDLSLQLGRDGTDTTIAPCITDVADKLGLQRAFATHRPEVVFHAAAYKHVPLMEDHVAQAIQANLLGTLYVCQESFRHGVQRLVYISTDKAVAPVSVMGATKRLGELLVQAAASESGKPFCAVRFGNVLGSRGSVIPTFLWQIEQGGPVTVTDEEATRYFMSIQEAVSLVIQAGAFAQPGELFVLDMGQEVRIDDLARRIIRFKGLRPDIDVSVVYTGLRPGERLHEDITSEPNSLEPTPHSKIFCARDADALHQRETVADAISRLAQLATELPNEALKAKLFATVERLGSASLPDQKH
ncbi:MAG: polysaccharide biosynthesis protein [Chloroflexi bacterium]|nr:polysaccharide biosynthesis protein [Chloroflexota bacterium]